VPAAETPDGRPISREWQPPFPLDLRAVLAPLRRGPGDPTFRIDAAGVLWRACTTPEGPATLALTRRSGGEVVATAWGPGAPRVLDGLPTLLGAADDDTGFEPRHPLVARARRRWPGLRLCATGRVWDVLVPAVLEQKVTLQESWRSWRELCRRFGEPAPGPVPRGMRVPPTARTLREIPDWEWHRAGVDGARRRTLRAVAVVAGRLERAVELAGSAGGVAACRFLTLVPGVGVWTAAEVAQRAWADADAVSVGDRHLPALVGQALVGRPLDDAGMLEVLAGYAPQRHRAVRYVRASGVPRPRTVPRATPRDFRRI